MGLETMIKEETALVQGIMEFKGTAQQEVQEVVLEETTMVGVKQ